MKITVLLLLLVMISIVNAAPSRYPGSNPATVAIHLPLDNETADVTENMFGVDAPTRNIATTDYIPQSIANGVDLDGTNKDVNSTFKPGTTDGFSFCWWINTTQGNSGQAFLGADIDVANPTFFLHESVGRMRVEMHDSGGSQSVVRWIGAYDFNNGLNHSICLTKRQGDCQHDAWELYIDTVRREPTRDDTTCSANSTLEPIWIGSRESISWADAAFDEMIVWNRLIDNATVASFHAGNWSGGGGGGGGSGPFLYGFNCTSCGTPFGDNVTPYTTSDTTPTFRLNTDVSANCRVDDANLTYNQMTQAFDCSTTGGTSHMCSLNVSNQLVTSPDYVYVACSLVGDSSASFTAELQMDITGIEESTDTAIDMGINHSTAWPNVTVYKDHPVSLRNLANQQFSGTVDRIVFYNNQRWIINYNPDNETAAGLTFNISPLIYVPPLYMLLIHTSHICIMRLFRDIRK